MDSGCTVQQSDFVENGVCEQLSTLSLCGGEEQENSPTPAKDPRKIARQSLNFIEVMARNYNFVADINHTKETWKIKVRVIRLWSVPNLNNSDEKNRVEMILMDEQGSKIQAIVFSHILREGGLYYISNFSVSQNGGTILATKHAYKINFHQYTSVRCCEALKIPIYGFQFVSFDDIISNHIDERVLVDVIAEVVGVGKVEVSERNDRQTKRLTIELENLDKKKIRCTLWEQFAEQLSSYLAEGYTGPIIIILQFAKVKHWRGDISLSNSLFASRLLINADVDDVKEFKNSIPFVGDSSNIGLSQLSTQTLSSAVDDFSDPSDKKCLNEICDIDKECFCIVLATIVCIETRYNWFYHSCKKCNKKVQEEEGKFWCKTCSSFVNIVVTRYKVHIRVVDDTGSASLVLFDREVTKILGKSASVLKDMLDKAGDSGSFPEELNELLDKKFLFRVKISEYNLQHNGPGYTVVKISNNDDLINSFTGITNAAKECALDNDSFSSNDHDKSLKQVEKDSISSMCDNEGETKFCMRPSKKRFAEDMANCGDDEVLDSQMSTTKKKIRVEIEKAVPVLWRTAVEKERSSRTCSTRSTVVPETSMVYIAKVNKIY